MGSVLLSAQLFIKNLLRFQEMLQAVNHKVYLRSMKWRTFMGSDPYHFSSLVRCDRQGLQGLLGGAVGFSVRDYSCREECYRCSMPPCSDERRDLWLCCYPQGPLLDVYKTRGMFKQLLMGLSIPLQNAVLSSPVPRISQQAGLLACWSTLSGHHPP